MIRHKVMTEFGIEAEIWKVGYISLDRVNKYGSITMSLFNGRSNSIFNESHRSYPKY